MIEKICNEYNITNYSINPDGTIDVNGDVEIINGLITKLPIRFNRVNGYFNCGYNNLTTLDGCPKWVGGWFSCKDNELTNLEFSPEYVGSYFICTENRLTSLSGSTKKINSSFDCGYNRLTSLEYSPRWVDGWFSCFNNELNSLEFSPEYVGGDFDCSDNSNLTNINGYTEKMNGVFYCYETPLQSIFNEVDRNFLHAFNFYKIIKDDTVNLKRLKYVMDLYEQRIDLDKIQKYYRLV
jgi:hypothetical protein